MTRWARSGNTQKHKKMPGEATPWEEFSTAAKMKTATKDSNVNQILKGRIEKKKHIIKKKFEFEDSKKFKKFDCPSSKANEVNDLLSNKALNSKFSKKKKSSNSSQSEGFDIVADCSSIGETESTDIFEPDESRKKIKNVESEKIISASPGIGNENTLTTKVLTKRQLKKAKKKTIALDTMRSSLPSSEVVRNQEIEISDDNNEETDIIPRDEATNMGQNFEAETDDLVIRSNPAPTTKVLTKLQLKKAKRKIKSIALEVLRSGRYDREVADDSENITESHNSSPATFLEIKNSKKSKKDKKRMSKNTVDVSLNENNVEIMDQEDQIQKKSIDDSVGALNNEFTKNETSECGDTTEVKKMTKNQWRKARIKRKFELLKAQQASEGKVIKSEPQTDKKSFTSEKDPAVNKPERKKQQSPRILLSATVESKISDLKKTLKEKGMSNKKVRELVRKERKHEKLMFKRKFSSKPCFNCRKIGHYLSDCPLPLGDSTQVTGVCFKCGSTEHTSYKCQKIVKGYPLAKCFICKEQGHISKDCPKNEHGVYINGGKCSLCSNVNHLSKDCPLNKKEKDNVVTIDTINEGISVDAEMIEPMSIPKNNFHKKKVVKF